MRNGAEKGLGTIFLIAWKSYRCMRLLGICRQVQRFLPVSISGDSFDKEVEHDFAGQSNSETQCLT